MDIQDYLDDAGRRDWETGAEGTVRFAVVGLGWWTVDMAIPALAAAEHCETTVAVSGSKSKAERVATDHGVEFGITYDEFHDGAAADAYDAVYVCSPNALHLPYAETAARLGKGVLCEKPMEASVERAERMVEACADADVPLMVGYRMQTTPEVRRARELIRAGAIGRPVYASGNNSQHILDINDDHDQWRLNPDLAGRGTSVTDIGIYPLNTARFLLDADPVSAQASMDSRHEAFDDVPDEYAAFTLTFDDGTLVTCTASQNAQSSTNLRVVGTEGELVLEPAFHGACELRLTRGENAAEFSTSGVDQMTEEFAYFADRFLSGEPMGPDGEHGVVDVRAIEAVYDAAERGETTDV